MTTITISLPQSMKEFIEKQVAEEGYGTVSEYVRGLLRNEQKRMAQQGLEQMLLEGIDSGPAVPLTGEELDQVRAEVRERHRRRSAK